MSAKTSAVEATKAAGHAASEFKPLGRRLLGGATSGVLFSAFDILDTSRSGMQRMGGVAGTFASTASHALVGGWASKVGAGVGTTMGGPVGTAVGFVIGAAVDMAVYTATTVAFGKMEKANRIDSQRMRDATRVGFHASDTFHTNEGMMLTQRQAAVHAMQGSVLNARSAIGNEAQMMRRSVDEYL